MLPAEIKVGHVFCYSYLWHWQHREGREDGDKDRPCLVLALVAMQDDGAPVVRVLPITHTPPVDPADAIEIPAAVKLRLRLDGERSWIVLTESNRFAWPGPTSGLWRRRAAITDRCRRPCSPRSSAGLSRSQQARHTRARRAQHDAG
jgi:hypothetical protein